MEQVLAYAIKGGAGLFAVLFIALLAWVLKTNDQRENRYLNVIDKCTDILDAKVTCIDGRVVGLEKDMAEVKHDVKKIMINQGKG